MITFQSYHLICSVAEIKDITAFLFRAMPRMLASYNTK